MFKLPGISSLLRRDAVHSPAPQEAATPAGPLEDIADTQPATHPSAPVRVYMRNEHNCDYPVLPKDSHSRWHQYTMGFSGVMRVSEEKTDVLESSGKKPKWKKTFSAASEEQPKEPMPYFIERLWGEEIGEPYEIDKGPYPMDAVFRTARNYGEHCGAIEVTVELKYAPSAKGAPEIISARIQAHGKYRFSDSVNFPAPNDNISFGHG